jgi:transposase
VLSVEDWAEIRRLHRAEEMPIKQIARRFGCSKNTVRAALRSVGPPRYERAPTGSAVDAFEPEIRELLRGTPSMPATVIAERVGWDRSITVLRDRVRELRPYYLPPDPSSRTTYLPGERMQCDLWFPPVDIPLGFGQVGSPPVLVMTAGYSRVLDATMIPTRTAQDLIPGHWALLSRFGAVPRELVWDQEGAVGAWRRGKPVLTEAFEAFRGTLGTSVRLCRARRPQAKGMVERNNDYYERSFLPGRVFTGPADFNTQIREWITSRANVRHHRWLGCQPIARWAADKAAMLALPPVEPVMGWRFSVRLPRDHYVRLDANDYSVDPRVIGRRVEVAADLDRVQVRCTGQLVADHPRCWAAHQSITDPAHAAAAVALRAAGRQPRPPVDPDLVEVRDLRTYDRAFGVDGQVR